MTWSILAALLFVSACGDAVPAPRVSLPVVVDSSAVEAATTDLGYVVTLSEARVAVRDIVFAVGGEAHASADSRGRFRRLLLPVAYAHPGHYTGGEVTGELRGRFILDWFGGDGTVLGDASLLVGNYESTSFTFSHGESGEGIEEDDPLLSRTAVFRGTATRDGSSIPFEATVTSPEGRRMLGAPFMARIDEETMGTLALRLVVHDTLGGRVLFDDIDFASLPREEDDHVRLFHETEDPDLEAAYYQLRRRFQTHDHFSFELITDL